MDKKRIIRSVIFFIIGLGLLWFVFKGTDLTDLNRELYRINWYWVALSVVLNTISQFIRALRWRMLFAPMQYNPKTSNLFLSILILAFTNQIIPRGGEIARLGIINRYDKIPFAKLFGTALVERLTDLVILLLIFTGLLVWQFPLIMSIVELPEISFKNVSYIRLWIFPVVALMVLGIGYYVLRRFKVFSHIKQKMSKIKADIREGFTTIYHIRGKVRYFLISILIYLFWLSMMYVLYFAYPPTSELGLKSAAFTFGLATLAFLLPVQSGMGAWHFLVIQSLILFGIDAESGKAFALMAHAATNLVYLPLGAIAFALLPVINNNGFSRR